jgi:hypothetical protein
MLQVASAETNLCSANMPLQLLTWNTCGSGKARYFMSNQGSFTTVTAILQHHSQQDNNADRGRPCAN